MSSKAANQTIHSLMQGDMSKIDQKSEVIEKAIALKLQKHFSSS